jgi:hypothetical protein
MAGYPDPEVGLVISYSYLWSQEADMGQVEGRKDRPCAIILAIEPAEEGKPKEVAVAPITHSPPADLTVAVEIPQRVKQNLGLDSEPSWVILNEVNVFAWPGFDLRPIKRGDSRVDYGHLPPKLFDIMIGKFKTLRLADKVTQTGRDE